MLACFACIGLLYYLFRDLDVFYIGQFHFSGRSDQAGDGTQ
jgi:hypothetical protein